MVGEGEGVLVGAEEEGEPAVVGPDDVDVLGVIHVDLEDVVPLGVVGVVVVVGGEEHVGDGEDLVGSF